MRSHAGTRLEVVVLLLVLALLLISACGSGGASTTAEEPRAGEQAAGSRVVPTMPAARFAQPTTMIDPTRVAGITTTPEVEEVDVEFGAQVYTRLCADCHGESLEGEGDKAAPIDLYELDEAALTNLLRTGGGYGREHLFGLDKVSPEGIKALHAYMQTLTASE
jgi:mono/diheme cytochrome c family protein